MATKSLETIDAIDTSVVPHTETVKHRKSLSDVVGVEIQSTASDMAQFHSFILVSADYITTKFGRRAVFGAKVPEVKNDNITYVFTLGLETNTGQIGKMAQQRIAIVEEFKADSSLEIDDVCLMAMPSALGNDAYMITTPANRDANVQRRPLQPQLTEEELYIP